VSYRYDCPDELADVIERLISHPEELSNYVQYGRQAVIDKYNWTVDGAKLVELYGQL
jgi:glycosyltransferase involved in cell wall biosynthesis